MVLINIKKPKDCEACPFCVDWDCIIHERVTGEWYAGFQEQYCHCPLQEVKE